MHWSVKLMPGVIFTQVAKLLKPKIKSLFYDTGPKKTTPKCGISVKGEYNPDVCFHGYEVNFGCVTSAYQTLPFFMNSHGPKYTQYTTVSHEQLPGHHLEVSAGNFRSSSLFLETLVSAPLIKWRVKTESTMKLCNFDFQWTKNLVPENWKHSGFLFTFLKTSRCNKSCVITLTKIPHGTESEKINVKFHKITSFTWNVQRFTCVFTILVKFDIHFPGLPWDIFFGSYYRWLITSLGLKKCKKERNIL